MRPIDAHDAARAQVQMANVTAALVRATATLQAVGVVGENEAWVLLVGAPRIHAGGGALQRPGKELNLDHAL